MSFLQSLFSGAKALIRGVLAEVREVVRVVLTEIDNSSVGRAATELIKGVTNKHFSRALDYVEEEREYAEKRLRDGRLTEKDQERLHEIQAERESLRKEIEAASADDSNNVLKNAPHTLAMLTDDTWVFPYTREQAAYPLEYIHENKFWPSVRRVDDAYGDRNLVCSCAPIEAYM